jgi:hypothetical protein
MIAADAVVAAIDCWDACIEAEVDLGAAMAGNAKEEVAGFLWYIKSQEGNIKRLSHYYQKNETVVNFLVPTIEFCVSAKHGA